MLRKKSEQHLDIFSKLHKVPVRVLCSSLCVLQTKIHELFVLEFIFILYCSNTQV